MTITNNPAIILDDNPTSPSMFSPAGDITPTNAVDSKNKAYRRHTTVQQTSSSSLLLNKRKEFKPLKTLETKFKAVDPKADLLKLRRDRLKTSNTIAMHSPLKVVSRDHSVLSDMKVSAGGESSREVSPGRNSMVQMKLVKSSVKTKSVPPVIRETGKKQSNMMAHAPIKTNSRRQPSLRFKVDGDKPTSNDTLLGRDGLHTAKNISFKSLANAGGIRASGGSLLSGRGLSVKTVRHTVNRDCMWYNPPHEKQEWKLLGKNKWRWNELK